MLLDKVIQAHGGKERWDKVASIFLDLDVKGNILATRLKSPKLRSLKVQTNIKKIECILSPFPEIGKRGTFTSEYVQIESDDGKIILKKSLKELFNGGDQLPFIWQDLHILYFFGYAFWNYILTPYFFSWPEFQTKEDGIWQETDGQIWHKLEVDFPSYIPTHCRKQTFYFNDAGLLCRLDYTAEIFGSFTRGAHYCWQHRDFNGLVFPTRRKVFWRLPSGRPLKLFGVMEGWIKNVDVIWK
ncbi:MAG: hypothetical protein HY819_23135 [Acidobacteria bacterium]|nr:hypothetical protein [Acidobacteriota bacterium]